MKNNIYTDKYGNYSWIDKNGNFNLKMGFKLEEIFKMQYKLQEKLGIIKSLKENRFDEEFINLQILALQCELIEVLNETRWKNPVFVKHGWKTSQVFNKEKAQEELADCLHFFINLCLALELDANKLFNLYMNKNKENIRRKENGY